MTASGFKCYYSCSPHCLACYFIRAASGVAAVAGDSSASAATRPGVHGFEHAPQCSRTPEGGSRCCVGLTVSV